MGAHSLYDKRKLCYTDISDYADYQGIGNDPLYKRYESVYSAVKNLVNEEYQHFLAHPIYSTSEDHIEWYTANWDEKPTRFIHLKESVKEKYSLIKEKTIKHYRECLMEARDENLQLLAGALKYIDDDAIYCYDDKVVVVAWGMTPDTNQYKITGAVIHEFSFEKNYKVTFDCGTNGSLSSKIEQSRKYSEGIELTPKDLPTVIPNEGYVFDGWEPNTIGHKIVDDVLFIAKYSELPTVKIEYVNVSFISDDNGAISGKTDFTIEKGKTLTLNQIPDVVSEEGKEFIGWNPSINLPITKDTLFSANYISKTCTCYFNVGDHGDIDGPSRITKKVGSSILNNETPLVKTHKGYKFAGWDTDPLSAYITEDRVFTAQYETKTPWYKAMWASIIGGATALWTWFTEKGCLKWILWLFLALILVFLLFFLLDSCNSCGNNRNSYKGDRHTIDNINNVVPIDNITTPGGGTIDDNNNTGPISIIDEDGRLPDNPDNGDDYIVAPIVGEDGSLPPIIKNPGVPDIIANRLNIYFEDEDVDMNSFIQSFKKIYAGDKYQIIAFDEKVKMIQIQIPEDERDKMRENLNSQLPNFTFFVVDESIFQTVGDVNKDGTDAGWHLKAINASEAWQITRGDSNIVIAVVDDGIDYSHSMFTDRIIKPYNIFTKNNRLSSGEGHGTHVAGLAVGSTEYVKKGVAGVAPGCKLMPVQVFDNKLCTFSSITSGIMYAIHEGADVVNVSISTTFEGLSLLTIEEQKELARSYFKNEEKVWNKIIQIANNKNCILVIAVGNDKVLASIPPENRTNSSVNVAAVDKNLFAAEFSNFGEGANISAPGVDIYSSFPKNSFKYAQGTSMSAPLVSGTVALMKSINKDITVEQVIRVLNNTGKQVSSNMPPMVQSDKALQAVKTGNYGPVIPTNNNTDESTDQINKKNQTDYSMIRKLIEEYKLKIDELEKALPENKNKNK